MSDFFRKNRSEVVGVSIYEYDEEGHMEILKEEYDMAVKTISDNTAKDNHS